MQIRLDAIVVGTISAVLAAVIINKVWPAISANASDNSTVPADE